MIEMTDSTNLSHVCIIWLFPHKITMFAETGLCIHANCLVCWGHGANHITHLMAIHLIKLARPHHWRIFFTSSGAVSAHIWPHRIPYEVSLLLALCHSSHILRRSLAGNLWISQRDIAFADSYFILDFFKGEESNSDSHSWLLGTTAGKPPFACLYCNTTCHSRGFKLCMSCACWYFFSRYPTAFLFNSSAPRRIRPASINYRQYYVYVWNSEWFISGIFLCANSWQMGLKKSVHGRDFFSNPCVHDFSGDELLGNDTGPESNGLGCSRISNRYFNYAESVVRYVDTFKTLSSFTLVSKVRSLSIYRRLRRTVRP